MDASQQQLPILAPAPAEPVRPLTDPPTFSVVIAAYQAAETAGAAVRSALEQSVPAREVIVVDDGSTDDLRGALEPFAERILLVSKQNGGGASALNAGAAAATGDFLAILDADDAYHPRRLEALAELGRTRPDLDLITTDAAFVVDGETVGSFARYTPFATSGQRTAIFGSCFVGGWPAVRLARLRALGGFDESLRTGYDWECWARLILAGSAAGLVEEPLYLYRLHSGTLTSARSSSLWDRVTLLEKTARSANLRAGEREALAEALRTHRSRAVMAEAQQALHGDPARRLPLGRALIPGIDPPTRLRAAAAALVPPLARRLVPPYMPAEERFHGERP